MVAIGGIADIVQHWHEMARTRMTQLRHWKGREFCLRAMRSNKSEVPLWRCVSSLALDCERAHVSRESGAPDRGVGGWGVRGHATSRVVGGPEPGELIREARL
jgi:hypothetical protein